MTQDRIGYGLRDGELVHVSQVERGLACHCFCASCGMPLVARKGEVRVHHFAHANGFSCSNAGETLLHRLAKEIIESLDSISIPPYKFQQKRSTKKWGTLIEHSHEVARGGRVPIDEISLEKRIGSITPDIVIGSRGKRLLVEIFVTHKIDSSKTRKLRKLDLPAIEIKLSEEDAILSPDDLTEKIKHDLDCKRWVFHPAQREAERSFIKKFRAAVANERRPMQRAPSVDWQRRPFKSQSSTPKSTKNVPEIADDEAATRFYRAHGRYPSLEESLALARPSFRSRWHAEE